MINALSIFQHCQIHHGTMESGRFDAQQLKLIDVLNRRFFISHPYTILLVNKMVLECCKGTTLSIESEAKVKFIDTYKSKQS